jgi:hypothetical protein
MMAAALGGLAGGCAGVGDGDADAAAKPRNLYIRLAASRINAGEIGSAILVPQGDRTDVTIEVSGVAQGATRPVHLYTFIYAGDCAHLAPTPAYALNDRVLADSPAAANRMTAASPPFRVSNSAPASLDTLRRTPHAIQVRTAPADGNMAIFCGEIKGE